MGIGVDALSRGNQHGRSILVEEDAGDAADPGAAGTGRGGGRAAAFRDVASIIPMAGARGWRHLKQ